MRTAALSLLLCALPALAHAQQPSAPQRPKMGAAGAEKPQADKVVLELGRALPSGAGIFYMSAKRGDQTVALMGSAFDLRQRLLDARYTQAAELLKLPELRVITWSYPMSQSTDCRCLAFWEQRLMVHMKALPGQRGALQRFDALDRDEDRFLSTSCHGKRPDAPKVAVGAALKGDEAQVPRATVTATAGAGLSAVAAPSFITALRSQASNRLVYVLRGANKTYVDAAVFGAERMIERPNSKLNFMLTAAPQQAVVEQWVINARGIGAGEPAKLCGCLAWSKEHLMRRYNVRPMRPTTSSAQDNGWMVAAATLNETPGLAPERYDALTATCKPLLATTPFSYAYRDYLGGKDKPAQGQPAQGSSSSSNASSGSGSSAPPNATSKYGKPHPEAPPRASAPAPSCKVEGASCQSSQGECCQDGYSDYDYTHGGTRAYTWIATCVANKCVKPKCVTRGNACSARDEKLDRRYYLHTSCCLNGEDEGRPRDGQAAFSCYSENTSDPARPGICKQ